MFEWYMNHTFDAPISHHSTGVLRDQRLEPQNSKLTPTMSFNCKVPYMELQTNLESPDISTCMASDYTWTTVVAMASRRPNSRGNIISG